MGLRSAVKNGALLLRDAERELGRLEQRTLEEVLEEYIFLLLASGLVAGIVSLLYSLLRGVYYDWFGHATIHYWPLLNYAVSIGAGIFFLMLFLGTFGVGLLALLLAGPFRLKLTLMIKLLCASLTPVLFFGWITQKVALVLLLWSLFLLAVGARSLRQTAQPRATPKAKKTKR